MNLPKSPSAACRYSGSCFYASCSVLFVPSAPLRSLVAGNRLRVCFAAALCRLTSPVASRPCPGKSRRKPADRRPYPGKNRPQPVPRRQILLSGSAANWPCPGKVSTSVFGRSNSAFLIWKRSIFCRHKSILVLFDLTNTVFPAPQHPTIRPASFRPILWRFRCYAKALYCSN